MRKRSLWLILVGLLSLWGDAVSVAGSSPAPHRFTFRFSKHVGPVDGVMTSILSCGNGEGYCEEEVVFEGEARTTSYPFFSRSDCEVETLNARFTISYMAGGPRPAFPNWYWDYVSESHTFTLDKSSYTYVWLERLRNGGAEISFGNVPSSLNTPGGATAFAFGAPLTREGYGTCYFTFRAPFGYSLIDGWGQYESVTGYDFTMTEMLPLDPDGDLGVPTDASNGSAGDPVNLVNGNMCITTTDITTPASGLPFQFTRVYNSRSGQNGPVGVGWTHNLNVRLTPPLDNESSAIVEGGDGDQLLFMQTVPGDFAPLPGEHSTLTNVLSGFAWRTKDKIAYNFNATGQLKSVTDRNGNAITLSHDAAGRLTSATDTAGRTYSFVYDTHGHLVSLAAPGGRTVTYAYDANDNLIRVVGPAGGVTTYEYLDPADSHNITRQTVDGHFVMDYTYDAMDRCTRSQGQGGGFGVLLEYHPELSYTRVTDARGNLQTCYYNSKGTIDRIVYPGGTQEQFVWSADVNRTAATTRDGRTWTYQYDGRANLTRTTDPLLNTVLLAYDSQDNLTSLTDERGKQTRYAYDAKGNLTRIDYADGTWETFTYNARGQPLTAADSKSNTVAFAYDTSGNLLSVTDPKGNRVSNTYDALGRRTAQTDAKGNKTSYAFDALNRVTKITNALSAKVNLTQTTAGLGSLTDPNSNTTQFRYNALDLLEETTDALGNKKTFTYDANGNLASRTNFNGASTTYSYDALDQLSGISYPNASSVGFQYDNGGRMTQMTDATGISRYAYDSLGRLATYTNGSAQTVSYTYDAAGNLVSLTYPGDKTVSYSYDDRGRLVQVADWAYRLTTYQYDDLGRLVLVTLPNGTKAEYKYDNAGRMTELRNLRADGSAIATYVYTLDGNGNIVAEDSDAPLQPVQSAKTNSYVIGADNRLLTAGGMSLAYDKNGNLTSNGATTYDYDYENRLTRVAIPAQGDWEYLYDGAGRRLRVTHGSYVRRFLVDPRGMTQVLAEYDGAGTLVCQYVYGLGLLYKVDASGNAYYYHYSFTGHTVAMTDVAGTIVNRYAYLPFGEPAGCQETVPNPFRYVGKYGVMDDGNGLVYMRARYYGTSTGRFLNKDPIGLKGGVNPFVYVVNNPINRVDTFGLCGGEPPAQNNRVHEWRDATKYPTVDLPLYPLPLTGQEWNDVKNVYSTLGELTAILVIRGIDSTFQLPKLGGPDPMGWDYIPPPDGDQQTGGFWQGFGNVFKRVKKYYESKPLPWLDLGPA